MDPGGAFPISWRAIIIGGTSGIGLAALGGTLVANAAIQVAVSRGIPLNEAYAELARNPFSIASMTATAVQFAACGVGGFFSASLSGNRPVLHGLLAGLLGTIFGVVLYLSPSNNLDSIPEAAWNLFSPILAGAIGGALYRLKTGRK